MHVCRHCDEEIKSSADAVVVGYEASNSGPGWAVWAHRAHAQYVGPDPVAASILVRVLLAKRVRELRGE